MGTANVLNPIEIYGCMLDSEAAPELN